MKEIIVLIIIFILLLLCVSGISFYVDVKNGDDLNDGKSIFFVFVSIKCCIDVLINFGDECFICSGCYY